MSQIIYMKKSIFSSSGLKQHSDPFRSETTLLSCVFSIIIVGVKSWFILKKSNFFNFYPIFIDFKGSSKRLILVEWCMKNIFERLKNLKMWFYHLQSLGSCGLASQLSANTFWASPVFVLTIPPLQNDFSKPKGGYS